jgi:hypothetical protein
LLASRAAGLICCTKPFGPSISSDEVADPAVTFVRVVVPRVASLIVVEPSVASEVVETTPFMLFVKIFSRVEKVVLLFVIILLVATTPFTVLVKTFPVAD